MIATVVSGVGRGRGEPLARQRPVRVQVVPGREGGDEHRRLGLAEQLAEDRSEDADRLLEPGRRHRRGPVPQALQGAQVRRRQRRVVEQRVDDGRGQERVGDPVAADEREELPEVGAGHDDDLPAQRHDREAEHPGRVGERREREVDRAALERVAHQRQGRHRLDVPAGQHHALRPAGGAAGPGDHDHVVDRIGLPGAVADPRQPLGEPDRAGDAGRAWGVGLAGPAVADGAWGDGVTVGLQADERGQLGQVRRDLRDQRGEGGGEDQAAAVEQSEQLAVLGRLVAGVDRAPDRPGAADAEHGAERHRVVAGQHRHLVARPDAGAGQRPPDRPGQALHVGVAPGLAGHGEAGGVDGVDRRPLVEEVDEPHGSFLLNSTW